MIIFESVHMVESCSAVEALKAGSWYNRLVQISPSFLDTEAPAGLISITSAPRPVSSIRSETQSRIYYDNIDIDSLGISTILDAAMLVEVGRQL